MRASDIHLETLAKNLRVRYRIDGVLQEMKSRRKRLQSAIIATLENPVEHVDCEHRIPQDGRIQTRSAASSSTCAFPCLPTNHGESIVMRILGQGRFAPGVARAWFFHR